MTPQADLFIVRHQPGEGGSVLKQDKSDVLIVGSIEAIGEIAGGFRDTNSRLFHKIRLSDSSQLSIKRNASITMCFQHSSARGRAGSPWFISTAVLWSNGSLPPKASVHAGQEG